MYIGYISVINFVYINVVSLLHNVITWYTTYAKMYMYTTLFFFIQVTILIKNQLMNYSFIVFQYMLQHSLERLLHRYRV